MNIQHTIWRLQQANEKAFYLAFLRVAVSLWFIKEMLFRWPVFDVLYSNDSFLRFEPTFAIHLLRINIHWLREHYMLLIWACMILLLLNLFGIGRNVTAFLLFLAFTLLYHMNNQSTNGGDEMSLLLLFYLSFANTYSCFTLVKRKPLSPQKEKLYNLISNLSAWSIMINLCLSYFTAGVFKLMDPWWQNGTGLYYFMHDERYSWMAAGGKTLPFPMWLIYILNYGTILLELLFPVLVWFKKYRNVIFILCLLMHAGIYVFLMIYGMTVIFIIQYGIFYSNGEVLAAAQKIKAFFGRLFSFARK